MIFTIYSKPNCTYCDQAKKLITLKGHDFVELILNVGQKQEAGKTYVPLTHLKDKLPTATTVPQIFSGPKHIGGFTQLQEFLR
jgi:glutaredoxin 3